MSFSTATGNILYNNAFWLYRPTYGIFKRIHDRHEISLLKAVLKPGDIVIDIGSNIGFYARILSQLVGPDGKVHCFEPDPGNFKKLRSEAYRYPNVILNEQAVGPQSGTINFYESPELNVDHRAYKPEVFKKETQVPAVSLDDYIKEKNINRISLIKMDIQGFEHHALKGMYQVLRSNADIQIISELWPYGLRIAGTSATEYVRELFSIGFEVHLIKKTLIRISLDDVRRLEDTGRAYYNIFLKKH